eukprot:TRINITY_DN3299_c3_g4_i1.p2 TRINITY_DN3299_c3_g4~~TRINITY_DN3299_c3_g4_i1.p2  ORF type:complete len:51 (+),score=11.72 TRINITY_DN3299_c3_g4_i1:62-214(+)
MMLLLLVKLKVVILTTLEILTEELKKVFSMKENLMNTYPALALSICEFRE